MLAKICYLAMFILAVLFLTQTVTAEQGRIYGKIHTDRGDILEGIIRWDKNEASWDDIIDGYKEQTKKKAKKKGRRRYGEGSSKVSIFGWTVFSDMNTWSSSAQCGIAFGHIKKLTPEDDGAEFELKGGEVIFIRNSSTDLGSGIREIVIETRDEGELELDWDDIEFIEFFDGGDVESEFGTRIYGTVSTSRAGEFTGWICWDMDEMFSKDIIDGRDKRRKRKIKFSKIVSIEKISSQASNVVTKDGKEFRLDDSNDVDSGNRGIVISDPKLGRVIVEWDEFEKLDLMTPPRDAYVTYDQYDGGRPISGTVYDEDGNAYSGKIRWDNDEEFTWELLDGEYRGVEFDIPFENIKSIEKLSRRSCRVSLWDGRQFRLRESNDVNDGNKGIFVTTQGDKDEVEIEWEDFDRIELKKK